MKKNSGTLSFQTISKQWALNIAPAASLIAFFAAKKPEKKVIITIMEKKMVEKKQNIKLIIY